MLLCRWMTRRSDSEKAIGSYSRRVVSAIQANNPHPRRALFGTAILLSVATALNSPPERWVSRGPGGGGAFFGPSINPFSTDELWVGSDMSDLFVSKDFGRTWDTVDFRILQGGNKSGRMAFTSNPLVRYALNDSVPMRSTDGGKTWTAIPRDVWSPWEDGLWADPTTTNRLLIANYSTLYISTNSGVTYSVAYANNDQLIAGVFWDGPKIYVGTRAGLLVSSNGGASFAAPTAPGIAAGESVVSFAGAKTGGNLRFFCVTWPSGAATAWRTRPAGGSTGSTATPCLPVSPTSAGCRVRTAAGHGCARCPSPTTARMPRCVIR